MTTPIYVQENPVVYRNASSPVHYEYVEPSVQSVTSHLPYISPAQYPVIGKKVDVAEHERIVRGMENRIAELDARYLAAIRSQGEHSIWQAKCRSLEEQLRKLNGVENRVQVLVAENRKLELQLQQQEGRHGDINRLQNELAAVTEKCRRLVVENRQLDEELQIVSADHRKLRGEVAGLERELVDGAAGVRSVKSQMQVRINALENELNDLIATLQAKDNLIASLGSQGTDLERLKADNIKLIREAELDAEEIQSLKNQLKSQELELRDVGRLRAEVAELRRENERLLLDAERYYKLKAAYEALLEEHERLLGRGSSRPMLGVEIKMLDDAAGNRDCVVVVHTTTPHGPAESAGIRPGDVLKEWDGNLIDSKSKFQRFVDSTPPGTRITLTVVRGNAVFDIPVTMGAAGEGQLRTMRRVRSETQVDNVVVGPRYGGPRPRGPGAVPRPSRYDSYE